MTGSASQNCNRSSLCHIYRIWYAHWTLVSAALYRRILSVLVASGLLCWPMICRGQMVGPTPQPPGIPVTPEQAEEVQPEDWGIHGQGTLTWQLQPAFHSPFQGANSLSPAANGRETIDAALYAGF